MKRIFIILLALVLALSSCSPTDTAQNSGNASSESSQSETEREDIYAKKIARNRKKVYEMLASCDDILDTIPNPATVDTVPSGEIFVYTGEELPDCIVDWAYKYFSYMVTGNVYEDFGRTSDEAQVLRFLTAVRRVNNEIADDIRITAFLFNGKTDPDNMFRITFYCTPYKYDESTNEYEAIPNAGERIDASFFLFKENDEWVIENITFHGGNYYDYANACKNKTWGRFPEVDRYDVVNYAICEYTEKLFYFGRPEGT